VQRAVGAVQRLPAGRRVSRSPDASSHHGARRRCCRPHHAAAIQLRRRGRRIPAVGRLASAAVRLVPGRARVASAAAVAGQVRPKSAAASGDCVRSGRSPDDALLAAAAAGIPGCHRRVVVDRRRRPVDADDQAGSIRATQFAEFVVFESHIDALGRRSRVRRSRVHRRDRLKGRVPLCRKS